MIKDYFTELLNKAGIKGLTDEKSDKLIKYMDLLCEKNKVVNLTAIREEKEILEKHFIDSLFLKDILLAKDKKIIDIGTGAGFPGLVLGICYPEKEFFLVDSVRKKVDFINEVAEKLDLKNIITSHERAEDLIKTNRETFDVGLCRGVSNLRVILEYVIPFLKKGGRFLPQKLNLNELEESQNALKELNSEIIAIHRFKLPVLGDERVVLEILKLKETNKKFPRNTGMPAKKPL